MTLSTTGTVLERGDRTLRSFLSLRRAFLRLESLYSGVSYEKLKLHRLIGVRLDQILIVERGAGRVIAEWSDSPESRDGQACGRRPRADAIAAIAEFEQNPKAIFQGGLRTLDLGESHIHLHATPAYVLAAVFGGPAIHKLERHMDAALRKSLGTAPALMYFTGGKAAELQGLASQIASAIERLLLDANLPPHGRAPRPTFAYAAIAALSLAGITATGEALILRFNANDLKAAAIHLDPSANAVIASPAQIGGMDRTTLPESAAAAHEAGPMAAPGRAAAEPILAASPTELLTWQINSSLLKLALAGNVQTPGAADAIVNNAMKSTLAKLPDFERGALKLDALNRFDLSAQGGAGAAASGTFRAPPISVSDQGVKVGLFSISGDGGPAFSLDPGGAGGSVAGAGAGVEEGVNANAAAAALPGVAQTLSGATAPLRGLGR